MAFWILPPSRVVVVVVVAMFVYSLLLWSTNTPDPYEIKRKCLGGNV